MGGVWVAVADSTLGWRRALFEALGVEAVEDRDQVPSLGSSLPWWADERLRVITVATVRNRHWKFGMVRAGFGRQLLLRKAVIGAQHEERAKGMGMQV